MSAMDEADLGTGEPADDGPAENLGGSAAIVALAGAALAWTAASGALALLVAVAAVQALLAFAWIHVLRVPGRKGGVVIAGLAAAGGDVAASLWPHSRLAVVLAVIGLAVPVMFVHQLVRGAARVRVAESFGAIAVLVVGEAALVALLQLRHQFPHVSAGSDPTFAVVLAAAGGLLAALFTDMAWPVPRFDDEVGRGLPAVLVAAAVGAGIGHLALRDSPDFANGRGAFVGAAVGIVVALLAVAMAFVEHGSALAEAGFARRARPLLAVLMPLALVAPVGYLLCVAIRT